MPDEPPYRDNRDRMTISLPLGAKDFIIGVSNELDLDLENSRIVRDALDVFIEKMYAENRIDRRLYSRWKEFRKQWE